MDYQIRCEDNRADWVRVRTEVFIEEQGFQEEFGDQDASATHLTLYTPLGELVGCGRFFETEPGVYRLGRIAVLPKFRGQGAGRAVCWRWNNSPTTAARRADVDPPRCAPWSFITAWAIPNTVNSTWTSMCRILP